MQVLKPNVLYKKKLSLKVVKYMLHRRLIDLEQLIKGIQWLITFLKQQVCIKITV